MNKGIQRAISTTVVGIVIIILIVAAGVGVYLATRPSTTTTTTPTTTTPTTTTPTTSTSSSMSTTTSAMMAPTSCSMTQLTFCFPAMPKGANATLSNNATVTIGVMTDLTSQLSAIGTQIGDAAQLAATAVNAWVQDTPWAGSVNFKVAIENYALSSSTAMTQLAALQSEGVSVVVGPLDSSTVGAIYSTAASDNIVLISPSSTSVLLAGVSPDVYRTVPNDGFQGLADARMMYQDGVRYLIIVNTNQAYGSGLANTTSARFKALGGTVVAQIPYDPTTITFTSTLASISSEYSTAVSDAGGNKSEVAIQAIGYQEVGDMLVQAATSYPNLLNTSQPWYGTDGESDSPAFTNSTYSAVSAEVRLPSTFYALTNTSSTNAVCQATGTVSKDGCSSYSLGAYDDVWLAADAILRCGTNSGSCISKSVGVIANESVGVTGPMTLGSNRDRVPFAYDIYAIATVSGTANWILAGTWTVTADTVSWVSEPKI